MSASLMWLVAAGAALALVPAGSLAFGWFCRKGCELDLRKRSHGKLVLTYDDGPSVMENGTLSLLAELRDMGVHATFYLIGWRAAENPGICDAIREAGHEIGCHTAWHRDPWRELHGRKSVADIQNGYRQLGPWLEPGAPFRPPRGHLTLRIWWELRRRGARLDFWSHDSHDAREMAIGPQSIVESVERNGGGVVLMHCHHREPVRIEYTLEVTRRLVQLARERNWDICTMSELDRKRDAAVGRKASVHSHQPTPGSNS